MSDRDVTIVIRGQNLSSPAFKDAENLLKGLNRETGATSASAKQLGAQFGEMEARFRNSRGSIDSLVGGFTKLNGLVGTFGVSLGATAIVGFAKHAINTADSVNDLAQKMGVSVEAAQRFGRAARQSGADIGNISQSIVQMNNRLAEGDKSTVAALNIAGLSLDRLRALRPEHAFRQIADAIARIPDPMMQTKVAMDAFGKSGADLLPMIRDGALGAADAMSVMDKATVKALADAKQTWENFWDDVTIMSAKALAAIGRLFDPTGEMRALLEARARAEAGQRAPVKPFAGAGPAIDNEKLMERLKAGGFSSTVQIDLTNLGLSPEEIASRKKGQELAQAHEKELEARLRQLSGAAIRDDIRLTAEALDRLAPSERSLSTMRRFTDEAVRLSKTGERLPTSLAQLIPPNSTALPIGVRLDWQALLGRSADISFTAPFNPVVFTRPGDFGHDAPAVQAFNRLIANAFQPAVTPASKWTRYGLSAGLDQLPQTILAALQGGGSVTSSAAGMLASEFLGSKGVSDTISGALKGVKFGGAIGNMIPGLGMFAGPALQALISGVGRLTGVNATKGGREDLAKSLGFSGKSALGDLYSDLESLGEAGKKLAHIGRNIVGRNDEAANKKWMADVEQFYASIEGGADKAARANAKMMREQGEAQDFLNATLEKYQFTVDELGPKWRAQRLDEQAQLLLKEYTALTASGVEHEVTQRKMGRNLFDFLETAKRTGTEVPLEFKKMAEEAIKFGTLVGENGEKIESLEGIRFSETFSQGVDRMIEKLDELIRKLTGDVSGAFEDVSQGLHASLTGWSAEEIEPRFGWKSQRPPTSETAPIFPMANGGIIQGPAYAYIERGRRELVGDEHMMARAIAGAQRFVGPAAGTAPPVNITINITTQSLDPGAARRVIRDDVIPLLADELQRSPIGRIKMRGALKLSTGVSDL